MAAIEADNPAPKDVDVLPRDCAVRHSTSNGPANLIDLSSNIQTGEETARAATCAGRAGNHLSSSRPRSPLASTTSFGALRRVNGPSTACAGRRVRGVSIATAKPMFGELSPWLAPFCPCSVGAAFPRASDSRAVGHCNERAHLNGILRLLAKIN